MRRVRHVDVLLVVAVALLLRHEAGIARTPRGAQRARPAGEGIARVCRCDRSFGATREHLDRFTRIADLAADLRLVEDRRLVFRKVRRVRAGNVQFAHPAGLEERIRADDIALRVRPLHEAVPKSRLCRRTLRIARRGADRLRHRIHAAARSRLVIDRHHDLFEVCLVRHGFVDLVRVLRRLKVRSG